MSRKATKKLYRWNDAEPILAAKGTTVISAGLDEVPTAYKDIEEVMDGQDDMVGILARFTPQTYQDVAALFRFDYYHTMADTPDKVNSTVLLPKWF